MSLLLLDEQANCRAERAQLDVLTQHLKAPRAADGPARKAILPK